MNKMLVAVFENETTAYEGLSALKELHSNSDITLYATAVINKDEKGKLELKTAADHGPLGTTTGLLAGSLIGLVGGPLGLAVGAAAGAFAGVIFDIGSQEANTQFVDEVSKALANGQTAIVAEIDETWSVPVDTRLRETNAIVFRRLKSEVVDDQIARESKAIAKEYEHLKEELREAGEEKKAEIKSAIAELERKAKAVNDHIRSKLNEIDKEFEEKSAAMQSQIQLARDSRKAKREKRLSEIKAEYNARVEKLKEASKLIAEAFDANEISRPPKPSGSPRYQADILDIHHQVVRTKSN